MTFRHSDQKNDVILIPTGEIKDTRSPLQILLCLVLALIIIFALTNLYSAGIHTGFFYMQIRHFFIGLSFFLVLGWILPFSYIQTYAYWYLGLVILLLGLVLVVGSSAGGAQRWLEIGPLRLQPSEFAKIALPIAIAKFFAEHRQVQPYTLKELWPVIVMTMVTFGLIFLEPDLGTAGFCLLIVTAQLVFIRLDIKSVGLVAAGGVVALVAGWTLFLKDYQKLRILNLVNPHMDPYGSGYNSAQSLIAVGSGGGFGKGYLHGTQTQLQFLPARHTDFVFSVFAEEQGFWACLVVFILFVCLTYVALMIARQAKDSFSALVGVGIAAMIFMGFTINVAMILGIFPVVGMPFPFFSFGGSAMLTNMAAMGLLIAMDREAMGRKNLL